MQDIPAFLHNSEVAPDTRHKLPVVAAVQIVEVVIIIDEVWQVVPVHDDPRVVKLMVGQEMWVHINEGGQAADTHLTIIKHDTNIWQDC